MCCLPLEVSIFLIFLIFYKREKFPNPPHGGRENVKRVTNNIKPEKILQIENIEKNSELVSSDTKTRSEEEELSFDSLADYDKSGCPKVPFLFAGMTGKTLLHKQQSNLKLSANQNVITQKKDSAGNDYCLNCLHIIKCCCLQGDLGT